MHCHHDISVDEHFSSYFDKLPKKVSKRIILNFFLYIMEETTFQNSSKTQNNP